MNYYPSYSPAKEYLFNLIFDLLPILPRDQGGKPEGGFVARSRYERLERNTN